MSKSSTAAINDQNQKAQRVKRKYTRKAKPEESAPITPIIEPERVKRQYIINVIVPDHGLKCPHCGHKYDHEKRNKYPNGRQRYLCGKCHKPFLGKREE